METAIGTIPQVSTELTTADKLGALRVRTNIGRMDYKVEPGLYAVGSPGPDSPVLASANYKLSFDVLRRELAGIDAWILVLDTRGINVWCAAGKGTFGTVEMARRIIDSRLAEVVSHRTVIAPQLGAPGVSAHEVKTFSGFRVVFGPVRAADLPAFLAAGNEATPKMRRVEFPMRERLKLTGVEMAIVANPKTLLGIAIAIVLLGFGAGPLFSVHRMLIHAAAVLGTVALTLLAGAVLTPVLLPWIPGRMFSLKGGIVGAVCGVAGLATANALGAGIGPWMGAAGVLTVTSASSFIAMNFTGSSTFTSLSGVLVEMRRALPFQVAGAALALVCLIVGIVV
jgi:hypothetical protein